MSAERRIDVFADTNAFLHMHPPDQVDWHAAVGVDPRRPLTLLVHRAIFAEIEHKKDVDRRGLRARARERSQQLDQALDGDRQLRNAATIEFVATHPQIPTGLRESHVDDVLIAAALERAAEGSRDVVIVSGDRGMKRTAQAFKARVLPIPEAMFLELGRDPRDAEIRQLQQELAAARAPIAPLLALAPRRGSTGDTIPAARVQAVAAHDIVAALLRGRAEPFRIPKVPQGPYTVSVMNVGEASRDQKLAYNAALEQYRHWDVVEYVTDLAAYATRLAGWHALDLDLWNIGRAPANNTITRLRSVTPCELASSLPPMPDLPALPGRPGLYSVVNAAKAMRQLPHLNRLLANNAIDVEQISATEWTADLISSQELVHNLSIEVPRIWIRPLNDAANDVVLRVELHSGDMPDPVFMDMSVDLSGTLEYDLTERVGRLVEKADRAL